LHRATQRNNFADERWKEEHEHKYNTYVNDSFSDIFNNQVKVQRKGCLRRSPFSLSEPRHIQKSSRKQKYKPKGNKKQDKFPNE
jgi:hypothetical protein